MKYRDSEAAAHRAARARWLRAGNRQAYCQVRYYIASRWEVHLRINLKVGADNGPEHRRAVAWRNLWYRAMQVHQAMAEKRAAARRVGIRG